MKKERQERLNAIINARSADTPPDTGGNAPNAAFLANLAALVGNNQSTQRVNALRQLFDPRRDIDIECGYPKAITEQEYRVMYDRELGRRVVNIYPEETWKQFPIIYENPDPAINTPFEADLDDLDHRMHLLHYLQRVDELSGVGHYGVILWGLDDGATLDTPVEGCDTWEESVGMGTTPAPVVTNANAKKKRILFIRVLDASLVTVAAYEREVRSPRYGLPTFYLITLNDLKLQETAATAIPTDVTQMRVHWSRVTHVADNRKTSEVMGTPRQEPVWNRLCDLRKVMGGSGEMFWRGGFPGISLETHPNLENPTLDVEAARVMMQDYMNGLQRYLATEGMTAKSLTPQIADPSASFEVQIKAICVTLGVPYRVFMGIEEGVVSGDQATKAWAGRLANRQNRYVTPMVINPVIQRLIDYGVLTPTAKPRGWTTEWPDLLTLDATEKATVAGLRTTAFAAYVAGGVDVLIPPLEYLTTVCGFTEDEAEAIVNAAVEHIAEVQDHAHDDGQGAPVPGREPKGPEPEPAPPADVVLKPGDKLVPGGKPARGNPKPKKR